MLIYLCDPSAADLFRLRHYLNTYARQMHLDFEPVSFSSGEALLSAYRQAAWKPELIFLETAQPAPDGIGTARQLRAMHYCGDLILTAAAAEYAMESYEVSAAYYLRKPYGHRHFENAMARCVSLSQKAKPHFTFPHRKKELSVPYENILFFETKPSHTIFLHTTSGVYSFSGTLTQIAATLKGADDFLPVGRSFLVNLSHVSGQAGNDLAMSDGSIVQIPLRRREEIFSALQSRNLSHPASSGCCPSCAFHWQSMSRSPENTALKEDSSGEQA